MHRRNNVLARRVRPTTKSYRAAVKSIVLALQADHELNDPELAERLGCSAGTIANARKENTNLDGVTLANIEYEFGPSALDPFLQLGGSRAVPLDGSAVSEQDVCLPLLSALQRIIETRSPDSDGGTATTPREAARILPDLRRAGRVIDALIALGEGAIAEVAA